MTGVNESATLGYNLKVYSPFGPCPSSLRSPTTALAHALSQSTRYLRAQHFLDGWAVVHRYGDQGTIRRWKRAMGADGV